jgi:hypothetical protein
MEDNPEGYRGPFDRNMNYLDIETKTVDGFILRGLDFLIIK